MPLAKLARQFRSIVSDNDGVFTRAQAHDFGFSDKALLAGLEDGMWVHFGGQGIYLLHGFGDTDRSRLRMHLLRSGHRTIVTGASALKVYGLDVLLTPHAREFVGGGQSFLSVPRDRHLQLPGVVFLRDRDRPYPTWINGFPLAPRARAVVDALRTVESNEALLILQRTLQLHWITPAEIERASTYLHRHRGLPQLRSMSREAAAGAHAESERIMIKILNSARLPGWVANQPIHDDRGMVGIGDFVFEASHLVVEVDGQAWHTTPDRFQRDRERQNRLVNAGWTVLRFTWSDLVDRPQYVIDSIRRALR